MRVIAVVNQKGGVGKTTTAVNLGAALARRGRRVLLVDMDPQGNLTDHLLGEAPTPPPGGGDDVPARRSIYDVLVEGTPVKDAIVSTPTPGLSVLPSDEDLAGAELDLASVIGREVLLRDALEPLRAAGPSGSGGPPGSGGPDAPFDYVFLDCPPSLGLLSLNALAAADEVFIALQTEFFAMRGLGALDRTIDLVRKRINPRLEIGGIVPTLVDATRLSRDVMDEVRRHYGDKVFATRVRSSVRLAEAPSFQKHIFDYAPDSPGALDYAALATEMEEGRAAVEAAAVPPTVPAAAGAPLAPARALRGIARAIAEAAAAVTPGGAGVPAPLTAVAAAKATPAEVVREAPRHRDGPRPVFLPPIPTRAPSALPRPKPAVAAAASAAGPSPRPPSPTPSPL